MNKIFYLLFFTSGAVFAAPPTMPPNGATLAQVIADRQGSDLAAHHLSNQNTLGYRLDEFSQMNPGSGQARSLFNGMVINNVSQNYGQTGVALNKSFTAAYKEFVQGGANKGAESPATSPLSLKVSKSQVQGLVFLDHRSASFESGLEPLKDKTMPTSSQQVEGGGQSAGPGGTVITKSSVKPLD